MRGEDPLFDPWGSPLEATDPDGPAPRDRNGHRWSTGREPGGLPVARPSPKRVDLAPRPGPEGGHDAPRPEPEGPVRPARVARPARAAARFETSADPTPVGVALRTAVLHPVQRFADRLRAAGHEAVVDDRSASDPPSVRFQLRPRPGPFDEASGSHAALEFLACPESGEVAVRTWAETSADGPATEIRFPLEAAGSRSAGALLEFIASVLGRS